MRRFALFAICAAMAVAACSTTQPFATVAAAEIALTTVEAAGTAYIQLPVCGGASTVCSDPATSAKIKAADTKAYNAVKAARTGVANSDGDGTASAAMAAVAALRTFIPGI